MTSIVFKKEHGDFACYANGVLQYMSHEIAVLFDAEGFVLLKIGMPDVVSKYLRLLMAMEPRLFSEVQSITSDAWDIDDLNKILTNTGHLRTVLHRIQGIT